MATNKKTSVLVNEQLPDFVRDEGPRLQRFIEAYYEFMEQNGGMIDGAKNILAYQDIDTTTNAFLQYFREEIYKNVPDDALVDKKLLAKHIREMYNAKGSEKSYKFLFRILFNEDLEIRFPGEYVFKSSDGRWIVEKYLRVTGLSNDERTNLEGQVFIGQTSSAFGKIEKVNLLNEGGILVSEVYLADVSGTFVLGETITSDVTSASGVIETALQEKPGRYDGTKGFLSSDQKLHDSYYYQEFSYVIKSTQFLEKYKQTVMNLLHPAGTKMFGETNITSSLSQTNVTLTPEYFVKIEKDLPQIVSVVSSNTIPKFNQGVGRIWIYNYPNMSAWTDNSTVGTGVTTAFNFWKDFPIGDLNSSRLVFGNNTTFNSENNSTKHENGAFRPGFVRQLEVSSNTLIGNGGSTFNDINVGDQIYIANTTGYESQVVKVISIASASSLITSPSVNTTSTLLQVTSDSTSGARLFMAPGVREIDDIIIFDTYGETADTQYAVKKIHVSSNNVMTIRSNFDGVTLSNGSFALIEPGNRFDLTPPARFDSIRLTFDTHFIRSNPGHSTFDSTIQYRFDNDIVTMDFVEPIDTTNQVTFDQFDFDEFGSIDQSITGVTIDTTNQTVDATP